MSQNFNFIFSKDQKAGKVLGHSALGKVLEKTRQNKQCKTLRGPLGICHLKHYLDRFFYELMEIILVSASLQSYSISCHLGI